MEGPNKFPVIILTGLSGAGKSTALNVFEDVGFFCVDGLPINMVSRLVGLFQAQNPRSWRGVALGMDIRQYSFLEDWQHTRRILENQFINPQVIFLEAKADILIHRYATTRRPHPLESKDLGLQKAIEKEKELLEPLREEADLVIETSDFSIHDLRRYLIDKYEFLSDMRRGLRVHIISFGFKYGVPQEADLVFDLRFMPNPYFNKDLHDLSGQDLAVAQYIFDQDPGKTFMGKFLDFLLYLLPLYAKEGRYRVSLALGCTGGRHRSVATAEQVLKVLKENNYQVSLEHRHLELG